MKRSIVRSRKCQKKPSLRRPETSPASSTPSATASTHPRLLDDVAALLPKTYNNSTTWIDALPAGIRQEVEQIKAAWQQGHLSSPRRSLARAISQSLQSRGLSRIGHPGVEEWLRR